MTETENVATYARIRPYNPAINEDKRLTARAEGGNKILNQNGDRQDTYNFTKVYDMTTSTNDLFDTAMRPLMDFKILQGINAIFIVYGQSGSGKSFTLIGEEGHLGVFPMSLQYLLKQEKVQQIFISSIEAYGVKATKIGFYDLVHQLKDKQKNPKKYDAYTSKDNSRVNSGNAERIEVTQKNCLQLITELQEVSHMAPTLKNPHSSRGHTVYFACVKMKDLEDVYFISVDLAGSEGQTALGTKDEFVAGLKLAMSKGKLKLSRKQMKGIEQMYKTRSLEAGCINNGLTQLQSIFGELIKQKISKAQGLGLRKILSSFINLKTAYAILFTLSASANNNKVTRATLNFAKQTQLVKVDTVKAKVKIDKDAIIKELNELIEKLKKELDEKGLNIKDLEKKIAQGGGGGVDSKYLVQIDNIDDDKDDEEDIDDDMFAVFDRINTIRQEVAEAEIEDKKWSIDVERVASVDVSQHAMSDEEMKSTFDEFDEDGGGTIDADELCKALAKMGQETSMNDVKKLIVEVDANGDGEVDFDEFKVMVGQSWFINAFHDKLVKNMEAMMANLDVLDDGDEYGDEDDGKDNGNNQELMDEIHDKQERIEELENLINENEMLQNEKSEKFEQDLKDLNAQIDGLSQKNDALNNKNNELKNNINETKQSSNDTNNKLNNDINTLKTENEKLKKDMNILENEKNKLSNNINVLKTENNSLQNNIQTGDAVNKVTKENYELKTNMTELEKQTEIERLRNEQLEKNNKYEKEIEELKNEMKAMKNENETLTNDVNKYKGDNVELNKKLQLAKEEQKQEYLRESTPENTGGMCSCFSSIFGKGNNNSQSKPLKAKSASYEEADVKSPDSTNGKGNANTHLSAHIGNNDPKQLVNNNSLSEQP